MKITALIENISKGGLLNEHGLCVHIAYEGKNYLLDTGASDLFIKNAEALNINLEEVDAGILSHAHRDHSGGYEAFFKYNQKAKVYLRKESREQYYIKKLCIKKYIGIPDDILIKYPKRFTYVTGDYRIDKGVSLIAHKTNDMEKRGKAMNMFRKVDGHFQLDDFSHEQSLVFEAEKGLVILNSCSHGGIENIIKEVKESYPNREILAVIGGFHLMGLLGTSTMRLSEGEVRKLGKDLLDSGVKNIYTCHCTGNKAFALLKEELGDRLHYFQTGDCLEF
ncbi:MBL fold metallo-hydrolase [Lachnoclostridium phytofermentans]|uniref:Beta-lactamase domain protein n=1 Tax=Lachnoclostridium phytofermentans (strain ATCC 700394 / DSM 18823 / ISDg) TaxID=357809 RepID=A9KHG6_LACP7|nr:MBL fold metallo-hydrolase [Lachnoclostridium phytofermentans]ABX40833.1 beta-lactamase domain protein [Lachnoclostridium phytofermentans ISDg]